MKELKIVFTAKEKEEHDKFIKEHQSCSRKFKPTIGGCMQYTIIPTGIGDVIKIKCLECGIEKDITDIDSW